MKLGLGSTSYLLGFSLVFVNLSPALAVQLDPSFGQGKGYVITDLTKTGSSVASVDYSRDLIEQPDGKVVVAGSVYNGVDTNFALVRYTINGIIDSGFGTAGIVIATTARGDGNSLIQQADGKLVLAGTVSINGETNFGLKRFDIDGNSLDYRNTEIHSNKSAYAYSVIQQQDGKLAVAGLSEERRDDFAVARYHLSNLQLDTSFKDVDGRGEPGTSIFDLGNIDYAYSLIQQTDGKLVAAGYSGYEGGGRFAVVRYLSNGYLDRSFASSGKVLTNIASDGVARSVIQQSDEKIVLAGYAAGKMVIVRYNSDGSIDSNFGTNGIANQVVGKAYEVVQQSDGKLVVAGVSDNKVVLVRYNSDGSLDPFFGDAGIFTVSTGISFTAIASVSLIASDKFHGFYLTAENTTASGQDFVLFKVLRSAAPQISDGESIEVVMSEDASPIDFSLTVNAADIDNDTLTWSIISSAANGVASVTGSGENKEINYIPNSNYNGNDTFTVQVSDTNGEIDKIVINVIVSPVNDLPVGEVTISGNAIEHQELIATNNFTDVDGFGTISYQWYRNDIAISGAVTNSYILIAADVGSNISVVTRYVDFQNSIETSSTPLNLYVDADTDIDGVGNKVDTDDDNDGIIDELDSAPLNNAEGDIQAATFAAIADLTVEATGVLTPVKLAIPEVSDNNLNAPTVVSNYDAPLALGPHEITWTATDFAGNISTASQHVHVVDNTAPVFGELGIKTIDARGGVTNIAVDIKVFAIDLVNGEVLAELNDTTYPSGRHAVTLTAKDGSGNSVQTQMRVHINPFAELGQAINVEAGGRYQIPVTLSGSAAVYPVIISYEIDSDIVHHGELSIENGTEGIIELQVSESAFTGDVITLNLNSAHHAVIRENSEIGLKVINTNFAPVVTLNVKQDGAFVNVIDTAGGVVTVLANITDANQRDTHSLTWNVDDSDIFDLVTDTLTTTIEFDPSKLRSKTYDLKVEVTEVDTNEMFSVTVAIALRVETELEPLGPTDDSDNDGVIDVEEGYGDSDHDGISDYLDDDSNVSRLPLGSNARPIQVSNGLKLSIGDAVLSAYGVNSIDATIAIEDIVKYGGDNGSAVDNATDRDFAMISNIISFNISGLTSVGDSVAVVIPLALDKVIPNHAFYRKFTQVKGWYNYVVDSRNSILSAAKDNDGNCPMPLSVKYISGLNAGDDCIQLVIEDGGENDADGVANGMIKDPGVLTIKMLNRIPVINLADILNVEEEKDVIIDASSSFDPEGDALTYSWNQVSGTAIELNNQGTSILSFTSPSVLAKEVLSFELVVSDGLNTVIATIDVLVANVNKVPSVSIGTHAESFNEGDSVSLTSESSDPDTDELTYLWGQTSGPAVILSGSTSANVSFSVPLVSSDQTIELRLTVSDGSLSAVATASLLVLDKVTPTTQSKESSDSGGGSVNWLLLLAGLGLAGRRASI